MVRSDALYIYIHTIYLKFHYLDLKCLACQLYIYEVFNSPGTVLRKVGSAKFKLLLSTVASDRVNF